MKRIIRTTLFGVMFVASVVALSGCDSNKVYVCNDPSSTRYHSKPNCIALVACGEEIREIGEKKAIKEGKKRCKVCVLLEE